MGLLLLAFVFLIVFIYIAWKVLGLIPWWIWVLVALAWLFAATQSHQ